MDSGRSSQVIAPASMVQTFHATARTTSGKKVKSHVLAICMPEPIATQTRPNPPPAHSERGVAVARLR